MRWKKKLPRLISYKYVINKPRMMSSKTRKFKL